MPNREAFKLAATRAIEGSEGGFLGIGRLSEKAMHRALKLYYEPNEAYHEVECLGSVADIKNEWGIIEIQRASLSYMIPKLKCFLPEYRVRVVHPVTVKKRVRWLNSETGEITATGKITQGKRVQDVSFELYKLREFIGNPNFELVLPLIECDEYRLLDGWDKTRKKGATRLEAIPRELCDELTFKAREDYLALIPNTLGDSFTEREFRAAIKSRSRYSYYALRLSLDLSLIERHREGKCYVYTRGTKAPDNIKT